MDADRLFTVVAALVCVAGIGMAATTVESSVDTTPDDVIDLEGSALPMGSGELEQYKRRVQSGDSSGAGGTETTVVRTAAENGSPGTVSKPSEEGDSGPAETQTQGPGPGHPPKHTSFLQWLLSLLRALLELLLSLLPVVAALVVLAALVRNRDRIAAFLARIRNRLREADEPTAGESEWRAAPTNDVARAWHEMVALSSIDRPETKTPGECASAAVERGLDRDAVERVTDSFEEVRYGHAEVTEDRRRRAREGLRQIRAQYGGEP